MHPAWRGGEETSRWAVTESLASAHAVQEPPNTEVVWDATGFGAEEQLDILQAGGQPQRRPGLTRMASRLSCRVLLRLRIPP